jgi:hypothetical protein
MTWGHQVRIASTYGTRSCGYPSAMANVRSFRKYYGFNMGDCLYYIFPNLHYSEPFLHIQKAHLTGAMMGLGYIKYGPTNIWAPLLSNYQNASYR